MADAMSALFQTVAGIVKLGTELVSTTDAAKRNAQLIEFQGALISLQSQVASVQQENATLHGQKRDLEDELKRARDWEHQADRYALAAPFAGCIVYALKREMSDGEPPHYMCATCFQKGQPSILQSRAGRHTKDGSFYSSFFCPVCKTEAFTEYMNAIAPQYLEEIIPGG